MTPKEKAEELFKKMYLHQVYHQSEYSESYFVERARECALITVEEQIKLLRGLDDRWHSVEENKMTAMFETEIEYWEDVKNELNYL